LNGLPDESWVDSLVAETQHVETPQSWQWWSYLCCISAAAGNNYYLTSLKGDLVYKPNIYVLLLGESGLGKGFPINRAYMLSHKADNTRVIKGRSSIQAIVTELSQTKTVPGKPLITDSRGFIINGELSTAIIADPDALTLLTDLYDGHYNPEWSNRLKTSGTEKLTNPYITCLFGSSPAHFYDSVPQANIEGGYIGRNLIIYEEKRSKDVDLLDEESAEQTKESEKIRFESYIAPKYVPHLVAIGQTKGRIIPSEGARLYFNSWRKEWRATQAKYNDKTGFINRVPDHMLKVAMLISLSRPNGMLVITERDMEEARDKVTALVYAAQQTTAGIGLDPLAVQTKFVLNLLIAASENKLTRKQLLTRGYGNFDAPTLDRIMESLQEMNWVDRQRTFGSNADLIYHLSGEPLANLNKFRERK